MSATTKNLSLFVLALCLYAAAPAGAGIAYVALRDGLWQVCYQESLDAKPRILRPDLATDTSAPALAPDGGRVAFEVPGEGILVCPLAPGGHCRSVTTATGKAVRPAWEPRSGELVFVRYLADARGEDSDLAITRGALESVGPLVNHTGNQDSPDLSPDGRWLAYSSAQTVSLHQAGVRVVRQLWVMDLATGAVRSVVPGAHQDNHPEFSSDGQRITFASDRDGQREIWVVGLDGNGLVKLTSGPGAKTWPAFSPDGNSILYTRTHEGHHQLWLIDADGSHPRRFAPLGDEVELRDPDWR